MHLSSLYVHPAKSMQGIRYQRAYAGRQGLLHDREWLLARPDGSFITAREFPHLLRVVATPIPGAVLFEAPGRAPRVAMSSVYTRRIETQVWKDSFAAWHGDSAVDAWFSDFLATPCQLLWLGRSSERRQKTGDAGLSFADGYPYLLINQASLDALNGELAHAIDARHMRPNLVVTGTGSYQEDNWKQLRIGEVVFDVASPCTRCVLTTVSPDSGVRSPDGEPLRTLARTRRREQGVCFGVNLVARNEGILECGSEVEILE
ncbi:MOSC domain-containing protein [Paludibacterium yongneupense]|uniref:MOSC domain-containing protein n=1 Tax=Paludibacterium yongneupense TaxID=400061 RepID=UPI00040164EA|nr:MOSC N-terminal beta barrel domain-containing protein [Paludibacterium yongneupense]